MVVEFQLITTKLYSLGIFHRKNCPYTFEQNRVVETRSKRVFEHAMTLNIQPSLQMDYCLYAFQVNVHVLNKFITKSLKSDIPYSLLYKRVPDFNFLLKLLDACVIQAKGFEDKHHPNWVYRLKKAIYGLKRAP